MGTADLTMLKQSAGAASWVLAVDVDTNLGGLRLMATGVAATDIFWLAFTARCPLPPAGAAAPGEQ